MQRLGSPGLVQRLPARTPSWDYQVRHRHHRPLPPWPKRTGTPMRKKFPVFEASTLLLDLDAEDNKYVRDYNEELDGVPEPAADYLDRQLLPLKKRVEDFEDQYKKDEAVAKTTMTQKFNPWHISDHDVLTTTLLGISHTSTPMNHNQPPQLGSNSESDEMIGYVLDQNGVPHSMRDNTSKVVRYMARRQRAAQQLSQKSNDEEPLEHALQRCETLPEIKRIISRLTQTPEGCQLVSESTSTLVSVCKNNLKQAAPIRVLSFLNDLTINLNQQGQSISVEALKYGLGTSLQCQSFASAQMYLKFLVETGCVLSNSAVVNILQALRAYITPNGTNNTRSAFDNGTARRLAIFSLLTGQELGQEPLQPSIRDMLGDSFGKSHQIYLECLARLGAFRTMWHEWQTEMTSINPISFEPESSARARESEKTLNDEAPLVKIGPSTEPGDEYRKRKAKGNAFTQAIQVTINSSDGVKDMFKSLDFAVATGRCREDGQLDMETIIKSSGLFVMRSKHSHDNTDRKADTYNSGGIVEAFSKRPICEALQTLQGALTR